MKKRVEVVVLGANGFVGSNLVAYLKSCEGYQVTALARPEFDLCKPDSFNKIPLSTDVIIHAAGAVGNEADEKLYWEQNVTSAYTLSKYINENGISPLIIYLSSGAVYGGADKALAVSDSVKPNNLYGLSKYLGEEILRCYARSQLSIVRLFFPYGPGQSVDRFLPRLCQKIMRGEPVVLNAGGKPFVNPVHIDDVVIAIQNIIEKRATGVVNIGGGEIISMRSLAELIGELQGLRPQYSYSEKNVLDMYCAPVDLIYTVKLREGLKALIQNLRHN